MKNLRYLIGIGILALCFIGAPMVADAARGPGKFGHGFGDKEVDMDDQKEVDLDDQKEVDMDPPDQKEVDMDPKDADMDALEFDFD